MENITNAIPVVAADDAVDDDDAKWLSVPLEDVPIGKRRRLSSLSAERKDGKSSSPKPTNTNAYTNNNKKNNNNINHNTTSYDKVDRFINAKRGCKECLHVETVPARSSKDVPIENVDRNILSEG